MNLHQIGLNFEHVLSNIGEDYSLVQQNGEVYKGKISFTVALTGGTATGTREFLFRGVATFPDAVSQNTFRGCYFTRNVRPYVTYLMSSTIPEPTTERIAQIYAYQCNETITLAYVDMIETEESYDKVAVAVPYAENIPCYFDSVLQKQKRSSDGNFDETTFSVELPAKYGVDQDHTVLRKKYVYNPKTKKPEYKTEYYRVESVNNTLLSTDQDNNVYGTVSIELSVDSRF